MLGRRSDQCAPVGHGRHDVHARVAQQAHEALAHERGILGDDDPHASPTGSSAAIRVPPPSGLSTSQHAAAGERALGHAGQAATGAQPGAADAIVGDLDAQLLAVAVDADADVTRAGVLDRVRHRLAGEVEDRCLKCGGSGSRVISSATGTGERPATSLSAPARPPLSSTPGRRPRAISRNSATAVVTSPTASSSVS